MAFDVDPSAGGFTIRRGSYTPMSLGGVPDRSYDPAKASADAAIGASPNPFAGQQKAAWGNMQSWVKSKGPTWADNRFETGLSSAEKRINALLEDPNSITESAAYKFRLGQGQEALQRQQAAAGMLGSGNRLMELTKYGQDMASQEYENQFGRLNSVLGTYAQNWNQDMDSLRRFHLGKGNVLANVYGTSSGALNDARTTDINARMKAQEINADAQSKYDIAKMKEERERALLNWALG